MYVNMHELANLAASKAQEMAFPPPPPEVTADPQTEKVSLRVVYCAVKLYHFIMKILPINPLTEPIKY